MIHQINKQLLDFTIGCTSNPHIEYVSGVMNIVCVKFDSTRVDIERVKMPISEANRIKPLFPIKNHYFHQFARSSLKLSICVEPIYSNKLFTTPVRKRFTLLSSADWPELNITEQSNRSEMFIWIGAAVMVVGMVVWMFT